MIQRLFQRFLCCATAFLFVLNITIPYWNSVSFGLEQTKTLNHSFHSKKTTTVYSFENSSFEEDSEEDNEEESENEKSPQFKQKASVFFSNFFLNSKNFLHLSHNQEFDSQRTRLHVRDYDDAHSYNTPKWLVDRRILI